MARRKVTTKSEPKTEPAAEPETVQADEGVALEAQVAWSLAQRAQYEWEQVSWEMRPHQQAFVRALFALLWLLAELLRDIRMEVRK